MRTVHKINWSIPGENRFTGPIAKAIDTYEDIPKHIRTAIVLRADKRQYDEIVTIDSTGIRGKKHGYVNLRQMFFGMSTRAEKVTRDEWPAYLIERGLVYTEQGYTVLIPLICGNVCRVDRVALELLPPPAIVEKPDGVVYDVPEPSSLGMVALGLSFILYRRYQNQCTFCLQMGHRASHCPNR